MINAGTAMKDREWTGSVIRSIPYPIAIIGLDGTITGVNGAFSDLASRSEVELIGSPVERLFERGAASRLLDGLKTDLRIKDFHLDCLGHGGQAVPVSVCGSVLTRARGIPEAFVLAVKDLREKSRLDAELEKTRNELERRIHYIEDFRDGVYSMLKDIDSGEREIATLCMELKDTQNQLIQSSKLTALGELAAGLAHELNQPLTVIKGLSKNILKTTPAASPHHEKLKLVVEASNRMEQIIRHLKVFSRSEEPVFTPLDLNKVIEDAFIIIKEILHNHSIETGFDLSRGLPEVLGNANRLEQVIINIASNAKDAMPGGGRLDVSTRTVEAGGLKFARMSFKDTGSGIPTDIIDRIFDPFFTTKESGKGTGLGLSISYGIIKDHNGDITVESEPGKGTAFHITIPAMHGAA
ncbi:MAG: ATP-binding protein [Deltaproteobacteria bacterium]